MLWRSGRCTNGRARSSGSGNINCCESKNGPKPTMHRTLVLWNFKKGGNREFTRTIAGSDNDPHSGGNQSARVDRGDVCRAAGSAWTVQRDSSGQVNADEAGSMARRQMVSRPGRQQRALLGNGAGDQEADAAGNLRATVYVQSGDNESSISAEGIGRRDDHYLSAAVVWSRAGGVQKCKEWLGTLARAYAAASGSAAAPLRRGGLRSSRREICAQHASQAPQ